MGITLSIIIPVYNAEKTLNRCVDSVLCQAFKNHELILVDDGSNDESGQLCDEYSLKDNRLKVIHKQNGGVSSARNAGLDKATGEWICFIDSDDYTKDNFLIDLNNHTEDLLLTNALSETHKTFRPFWNNELEPKSIQDRKELDFFINKNIDIFKSPIGKFYKHKLIGDLRFNSRLKIGEDAEFVFNYLTRCCSIATLPESFYVVRNYYGIPTTTKYGMSADYAIDSLSIIFNAYDKASVIFNLRHDNFIFYYFFFKLLSKNDWKKHYCKWYCNKDIRKIYKYIYSSLSTKQKAKENILFLTSRVTKIFNL